MMKTYLLDSLNRYSRFSENLDVKTILCNKSWWIFNDSGIKELYIFQENDTLIASANGNVINATWQYIPANKSLIIAFKEQSYMLHPSFIDEIVFALQQDGTEQYFFMIKEEQCGSFQPKSLKELDQYFLDKEKKEQQRQIRERQRQIEARQAEVNRINREVQLQTEKEKEQKKKERRIAERTQLWEEQKDMILASNKSYHRARYNDTLGLVRVVFSSVCSVAACLFTWYFTIISSGELGIFEAFFVLAFGLTIGILTSFLLDRLTLACLPSRGKTQSEISSQLKNDFINES